MQRLIARPSDRLVHASAKRRRRKSWRGGAGPGARLAAALPTRWGITVGLALAVGLAVAGVAGGVDNRVTQELIARAAAAGCALAARAGFTVQDIFIEGRRHTSKAVLRAALGVERGAALLAVDLGAARERLEAIDWVESASVRRQFPGRLYVRLEEREPMALWQSHGKLVVVDQKGSPLPEPDVSAYPDLPVLVGAAAPRRFPALRAILAANPGSPARLAAAVWVGGRRWNLRLADGVELRLPERGLAAAWKRFVRLVARDHLLERDVAVIDLRLVDRLVVRLSPTAGASGPRAAGDDA